MIGRHFESLAGILNPMLKRELPFSPGKEKCAGRYGLTYENNTVIILQLHLTIIFEVAVGLLKWDHSSLLYVAYPDLVS